METWPIILDTYMLSFTNILKTHMTQFDEHLICVSFQESSSLDILPSLQCHYELETFTASPDIKVVGELTAVLLYFIATHIHFISEPNWCTFIFSNCALSHQGLGAYQEHLAPGMSYQI